MANILKVCTFFVNYSPLELILWHKYFRLDMAFYAHGKLEERKVLRWKNVLHAKYFTKNYFKGDSA